MGEFGQRKSALENQLSDLCQKHFGGDGAVTNLKRLTGGANAETWSFDFNQYPLILRRKAKSPDENQNRGDDPQLNSIHLGVEADLISLAAIHDVPVPKVYFVTDDKSSIGNALIMSRVEGEALPQKLFKDPMFQFAMSKLTEQASDVLAKLHAIETVELPANLETRTPASSLEALVSYFSGINAKNPIISLALKWLNDNCPAPNSPALVHADFRVGNLLIDEHGISAVLDWELAHIGDPVSDISHMCAPPWRFGRYELEAGGFATLAEFVAKYEEKSGRSIQPERLLWWRMYGSVRWISTCLMMANMWRSGSDRELERIVVGTRVSESELDILLLFDEIFDFQDQYSFESLGTERVQYRAQTRPNELASAVSEWISEDLIPNMRDRERFQARVARNAVGIIDRAIRLSPVFVAHQRHRLSNLNLTNDDLCAGLSDGSLSLQNSSVRRHLKLSAYEQVSIDQPTYAGLRVAKERWIVT